VLPVVEPHALNISCLLLLLRLQLLHFQPRLFKLHCNGFSSLAV